jgi:ankyrin repeat protein
MAAPLPAPLTAPLTSPPRFPPLSRPLQLLHRASRLGRAGQVRVLLEAGAWARTADSEGKTPLHDAAWCSRALRAGSSLDLTVPRMLLDWDESLLRAKDRLGCTPLD